MIRVQTVLKQKASESNTALWIIEKDYALSYLLSAIYQVPYLKNFLVLKGGTALKKAYFKEYRFSEDLDFSSLPKSNDSEIRIELNKAIIIMKQDLQKRGPFDIQSEPLTLREPHPGKQIAYTIRVQFPYHREPICRLKVEITMDEPVLLAAESKPIIHEYAEDIKTNIEVYQIAEIVAEKYRALLQSLARLRKKGWGANRVCRDYYDLWWILTNANLSNVNLPSLLEEKSAVRNVKLDTIEMFFDEDLYIVAKNEWKKLLIPFIPEQVALETVFSELRSLTQALWKSEI
jgi:uncharacterized protein